MERKLAAIWSSDVQGYSRLMGDDEEATIRTLTTYRDAMSELIGQHQGRVVDSPGDNGVPTVLEQKTTIRLQVIVFIDLLETDSQLDLWGDRR